MRTWSVNEWTTFLGILSIVIGSVIAAMATAAVKIIGALQGVSTKVDALEIKVDGRLSQLLERTALASAAEGREAGRGEMVVAVPIPLPEVVDPNVDHLVIPLPSPVPTIVLVPPHEKEPPPQ